MKDSNVRLASRFHKFLFRASGGFVGKRLVNNDMLLLTTTGRRSGQPHMVPLLYLTDNDRVIVIASYGGRDYYPDWYLNLTARPAVSVQIGRRAKGMTARTATAEERADWWPRIVGAYPGYAEYQSRTSRQIPVVILNE
jgi:deazaflavin-dependent oxidoreductase (nitroreductase family)